MDLQEFGRKLDAYRLESPEVRDMRLMDECVVLLEELQGPLRKLRDPMNATRLAGCLEACKEILVELLDFLTERFGSSIVENDLQRICDLRDTVRDLQSIATRGFWGRLFYANSSHDDFRNQAARQVAVEFFNTFRSLLGHPENYFETDAARSEWRSHCRVFLEDFRNRWAMKTIR